MIREAIHDIERGILATEINIEATKLLSQPGWEVEVNKKILEKKLASDKVGALKQILQSL